MQHIAREEHTTLPPLEDDQVSHNYSILYAIYAIKCATIPVDKVKDYFSNAADCPGGAHYAAAARGRSVIAEHAGRRSVGSWWEVRQLSNAPQSRSAIA